mgnify:CR=1 FL=1
MVFIRMITPVLQNITALGIMLRTASLIGIIPDLLSITILGIMLRIVFLIGIIPDLLSITILGIMLRTVFLTGIKTVFIITTAMNGAILQTVRSTLTIQDL